MLDALNTQRFPYGTMKGRFERSRKMGERQLVLNY